MLAQALSVADEALKPLLAPPRGVQQQQAAQVLGPLQAPLCDLSFCQGLLVVKYAKPPSKR